MSRPITAFATAATLPVTSASSSALLGTGWSWLLTLIMSPDRSACRGERRGIGLVEFVRILMCVSCSKNKGNT